MGNFISSDELTEEFEIVFNSCGDALFMVDVTAAGDYSFLYLNDAYERLTGFRSSELKGKTPREVFGSERGTRLEKHYRKCVERKEKVNFEESLIFPGGDKHFITELNPVVKGGQVVRIIGSSRVVIPGENEVRETSPRESSTEQMRMSWPGKAGRSESGIDALAMADEQGEIFYVNEDFLRIFGYESDAEAIGKHPLELRPEAEHSRAEKFLEMVKREGISRREVQTLENKSRVFDVRFDLGSVRPGAEEISCTMISFEDMEERVQQELELKLAHSSVDNAPLGILWITPDGELEYANNRVCEMLGYSRDELIEMKLSEVDVNASVEVREERWNEVEQSKTASFESRYRNRNGETFPVEVTGRYLEHEGREYEIVFVEDITRRKERERKLKLTQFSMENAGVGIFWVRPGGQFEYVNKTTCEMLNYSRNELVGMSVSDVDPEHSTGRRDSYWEELRETGTKKFETQLETKHGKIFPAEIVSRYLEFRGKKYEFAFVRDITTRREKAEELREANQELAAYTDELETTEQRLREEIEERKKSEEKLQKSLEEKEILQKEVHHRVKNNLFLIISLLDMQRLRCDEPEVEKSLAESTNRIHSMALVHQKIYTSKNIEKLDFANYLRELVGELADSYAQPEQEIDIRYDIETEPLDLDQIIPCGLILNELVANAFQHGFSGYGEGVLEVGYCRKKGKYWIQVGNTGNPLPDDFDLNSVSSLGLKLVKRLVCEQLNGTVEVEGGDFVEFRISFPVESSGD